MPDKVWSNVANACCKRVCECACGVCVCVCVLCVWVHSPNMLSLKLFTCQPRRLSVCLPNCPSNRSVCILIFAAHRLRQSHCALSLHLPRPLLVSYLPIRLSPSRCLFIRLSLSLCHALFVSLSVQLTLSIL